MYIEEEKTTVFQILPIIPSYSTQELVNFKITKEKEKNKVLYKKISYLRKENAITKRIIQQLQRQLARKKHF